MPLPARAQVILDMSLITCQQYLGYDPRRQEMVASWMSGYFNVSINQPVVSFERFDNKKNRRRLLQNTWVRDANERNSANGILSSTKFEKASFEL